MGNWASGIANWELVIGCYRQPLTKNL